MPTHTVAFAGKTAAAASPRPLVPVVLDTFFAVQGQSFLLPDKMHLVAAYAVGTDLLHAQVIAPSLLAVGYPFIRPLDKTSAGTPPTNPNFQVFHEGSLTIPSGEPVSVAADTKTGGSDTAIALLWFHHHHPGHHQPPHHEQVHDHVGAAHADGHGHGHRSTFWLRYTLTAPADQATVPLPNAWNQFVIEFEQTLPAGTYAVLGLEHVGPTAVAARLIFPGSVHRPGTVAGTTLGSRTFQGFYEGLFGIYGHFKTISLPYIEVLTLQQDDVSQHEGYMRVTRVGDLDHHVALTHSTIGAGAPAGPGQHPALHPMQAGPPRLTVGGTTPMVALPPAQVPHMSQSH